MNKKTNMVLIIYLLLNFYSYRIIAQKDTVKSAVAVKTIAKACTDKIALQWVSITPFAKINALGNVTLNWDKSLNEDILNYCVFCSNFKIDTRIRPAKRKQSS